MFRSKSTRIIILITVAAVLSVVAGLLFPGTSVLISAGCVILLATPFFYVFANRKRIKRTWLWGPAAFIVLLAGIEIGLRLGPFESRFMPLSVGKDFKIHPLLFWVHKDTVISPDPLGEQELEFRTGPVTLEKPEGVYRIFVMGGSNAWGSGVKVDETFSTHLTVMLKDKYPAEKFEVINAALPAFRLFQVLVFYKLFIRNYSPDLIIFYGNINDGLFIKGPYTLRQLFKHRTGIDISSLWLDNENANIQPAMVARVQNTMQHIRTYNAMVKWIRDIRDVIVPGHGSGLISRDINPPEDYERNLTDLIAICKADGVKLLLADAYQAFEERIPFDPRHVRVSEIMKKVANTTGTPYIPIQEILLKGYDPAELIIPDDTIHINPFGHKIVSELLFKKLEDESLLE